MLFRSELLITITPHVVRQGGLRIASGPLLLPYNPHPSTQTFVPEPPPPPPQQPAPQPTQPPNGIPPNAIPPRTVSPPGGLTPTPAPQ